MVFGLDMDGKKGHRTVNRWRRYSFYQLTRKSKNDFREGSAPTGADQNP